jgi:adenine deaminase
METAKIRGNLIDIIEKQIYPAEITVSQGKISEIRHVDEAPEVFIMPGLIDSHVHIESSMLTPAEFAKAAVKSGTIACVSDPHEIANVCGRAGVEYMIESGNSVPFNFYFGAPSCVPATNFESSGAKIDIEDLKYLFDKYELKYLSEMMNFPGVVHHFPDVIAKIELAKAFSKPIDGHAPGLAGEELKSYVAAGISTDHECFTLREAEEKIALGMKVLIREGSAAKNFEALHMLISKHPDMTMLCSDDKHPDDLCKGHLNKLVLRALAYGHDLFDILTVAIKNPIEHYGLDCGLLRLGDPADFIVIDSLTKFEIQSTYIDGKEVYSSERGISFEESEKIPPINNFNISHILPEDLLVPASSSKIRVIEAMDGELITNEIICEAKIENDLYVSDPEQDILKICVVNRYKQSKPACAFIRGFGLKYGAIASSVGHDSHNICAVGTNDKDLLKAINTVIDSKGGMSLSHNDKLLALSLPVAGLMSDEPARILGQRYHVLNQEAKSLGSNLNAPFMTLSFMALLVIPSLKLSDKGLFDGINFKFTGLSVD